MKDQRLRVLRLNANTFPVYPIEREILAQVQAEIIEVELPEECQEPETIDAIIIVSAYLQEPVMRNFVNCRLIARMGTGTDKIDITQATRQNIMVTNIPDFASTEVADHTLALFLAVARRLKDFEKLLHQGRRDLDINQLHRLNTQTFGIIGFGHIGQEIIKRVKAFGLKVLACDPYLTVEKAQESGVEKVELSELLTNSDYVCLMCPLTPQTNKMLGMAQFKQMKPTASLINTGRGELVDEDALAEALKTRVIAYAGIDVYHIVNVFTDGGFSCDHALFGLDNVILTPHVAANSVEALEESHRRCALQVLDVLEGRRPPNVLN